MHDRSVLLGVLGVIAAAGFVGGSCFGIGGQVRRRRQRVRKSCFWRLAWYRLTKRMPGSCPQRDLYRLSGEDRAEFGALAITYHLGVPGRRDVTSDRPGGDA